jgi:hypothetical protein
MVLESPNKRVMLMKHETNPNVDLSVRTFTGKNALSQADQSIDLLNNQIGRSIGAANADASRIFTKPDFQNHARC